STEPLLLSCLCLCVLRALRGESSSWAVPSRSPRVRYPERVTRTPAGSRLMADLPYRIVIGLEVHVQLLTRTKLFCGCSTAFGLPPNSCTCPVCTGMPGALPVLNRRAFDLALRAALALNCRIAPLTKWDRKN